MGALRLFENIKDYCKELENSFSEIPPDRQELLKKLSTYIRTKLDAAETPSLVVICTHNSRRSHFGQIWLAVAAEFYGLSEIETFSGGTEATALNKSVVSVLQDIGFDINVTRQAHSNPIYHLRWGNSSPAYQAFSKKYDSAPNPAHEFAAIMVCSEADEGCPVVEGADFRISLPFKDPKISDGTEEQEQVYAMTSREIAIQMLYIASGVY